METSSSDDTNLESSSPSSTSNGGGGSSSRILGLPYMRFLQSPVSSLLEYSGLLRIRPDYPYSEARPLIPENMSPGVNVQNPSSSQAIDGVGGVDGSGRGDNGSGSSNGNGEVAIRIIGEREQDRIGSNGESDVNGIGLGAEEESMAGADDVNGSVGSNSDGNSNREASTYQRYDIQQVARWIEQILPFSLLLLVVFIRQHLQGKLLDFSSTLIVS